MTTKTQTVKTIEKCCGEHELKVLTFNIGQAVYVVDDDGNPTGALDPFAFDRIVEVILASGADVVCLQETRGQKYDFELGQPGLVLTDNIGQTIANACGVFPYVYQDERNFTDRPSTLADIQNLTNRSVTTYGDAATLSKYPIISTTKYQTAVTIRVDGCKVQVFNLHFVSFPYLPYMAVGGLFYYGPAIVPYYDIETYASGLDPDRTGVRTKTHLFSEVQGKLGTELYMNELDDNADAWVIAGDFNCPSGLDWTGNAINAFSAVGEVYSTTAYIQNPVRGANVGVQPYNAAFYTTSAPLTAGFVDTYRTFYPDEITNRGLTWKSKIAFIPDSTGADPAYPNLDASDDKYDRIDFVYFKGCNGEVVDSQIIGENAAFANIVIADYPSDHRAVVSTVKFSKKRCCKCNKN